MYAADVFSALGVEVRVVAREDGLLSSNDGNSFKAFRMIQPVIQAASFDSSVAEMAGGQYWIHPARAEVLENAILGLGCNDD